MCCLHVVVESRIKPLNDTWNLAKAVFAYVYFQLVLGVASTQ